MEPNDAEKKKQYKQYSYWMILVGILFIFGGYITGSGGLLNLIGFVLAGAGVLVFVTNRK